MNRAQHPQRVRTTGDDRASNKAREAWGAIRHPHTVTQRAATTPMGAPRHRVKNPANPSKPAGAGEALRTQGKGCSPTEATSAAIGQAYGVRRGRNSEGQPAAGEAAQNCRPRKSTAQGGKPSAAPKTPQTQQTELHRRSRTGNWSQKRLRNPLRVTCGRTRCGKTACAAGRGTEANYSQWLNNSQPRTQQEERKKTAPPPQKGPTHKRRDNQWGGPQHKSQGQPPQAMA